MQRSVGRINEINLKYLRNGAEGRAECRPLCRSGNGGHSIITSDLINNLPSTRWKQLRDLANLSQELSAGAAGIMC